MENQIDDLKQKQRKLLFRFGEWLYHLFKSGEAELAFPSENSPQEKEIDKLFNMLNFLDERIRKFENAPVQEEPAGKSSEKNIEQNRNGINPERAYSSERFLNGQHLSEAKTFVNGHSPFNVKEEAPEVEKKNKPEPVYYEKKETFEPQELPPRSLEEILEGSQFESESQERLFIENLEKLQIGNEEEREKAFKNISHFSGKTTLRKVSLLMLGDSNPKIRVAALKAISRMHDSKNAQHFRRGLRDSDANVRVASIKTLSVALLSARDNYLLIEPMLKDVDPSVRSAAVLAIGVCGGSEGVRVACQLSNDKSANVRKSLMDMLAVMHMASTLPIIKQLIDDPDETVRQAAANALNKATPVEKKEKLEKRSV